MIDPKTDEFTAENILEWLNHRSNHPGQLENDIRCWAERDAGMSRAESVELGSDDEPDPERADEEPPAPPEAEDAAEGDPDEAEETDSV